MITRDRPLRLTFTFPGSASLGAFQAGAVSAVDEMIWGLRDLGYTIHVDAVGGASAGSIVATMFAHCQLNGLNTALVLRKAWLDEVDVDLLRATDSNSPLGFDELQRRMPEFLDKPGSDDRVADQPMMLHIGLTNLLGLTYPIETKTSESLGITYVDWAQFTLKPRGGLDQLTKPQGRAPLDFAYASAAHPGAFMPRALDRRENQQAYLDNGIKNFPESGVLWYTDGGLVESKPIGRIVQIARSHAGSADSIRVHIVIDPRSSGPSGSERWKDPTADPSWLAGVRRALSILPTQALQDDLRGVAVTNRRLERIQEVVAELAPLIEDKQRLNEVADHLDGGRQAGIDAVEEPQGDPTADALRRILNEIAGVADKELVDVEVISPLSVAENLDRGVSDVLAGDFIGAFGGFLSRQLRVSDYQLGWSSTRQWMPEALERRRLPKKQIDAICDRLDSCAFEADDAPRPTDAGGIGSLGYRGRYRLAMLAGRVGRILLQSAMPDIVSNHRRS